MTAVKYNIETKVTDIIVTDPKEVSPLLKLFIATKGVEGKSKGTLKSYALAINHMLHGIGKQVEDITTNDLRVYLHTYKQSRNVTNSTLETMRHVFTSFFTWLVAEEYIQKNPAIRLGAFKFEASKRHAMDLMELEYVREACKTPREKALIDFLFSTGCRVSEACNVKLEDVDLTNKTVYVRNGKGGKSRMTYLNPEAVVSIKTYLKTRRLKSDYLFGHERDVKKDHLSNRAMESIINAVADRCKDKIQTHITPHVFRHTAATLALRNGMPVEQVKSFLGHSKIDTTLIYAKINDEDVQRSHERYLQ